MSDGHSFLTDPLLSIIVQKMKFSIKDFFSKCGQNQIYETS